MNPVGANSLAPATCQQRWYLIHCKPRQDERALENLERQGFRCYRPVIRAERRRDGRKHLASESLFPRYLFIRLDRVNDNWYLIRSTRGVNRIVRFNNEYPQPVQDEIIEGIRARLAGQAEAEPYFRPGERVRIVDGAFSQFEAIFLADDGNERVVLLFNILQTDQGLSFPLQSVRKTE